MVFNFRGPSPKVNAIQAVILHKLTLLCKCNLNFQPEIFTTKQKSKQRIRSILKEKSSEIDRNFHVGFISS